MRLGGLLPSAAPVSSEAVEGSEVLDVVFGRYKLRERLASGGMGIVYLAEDSQLKRTVALKMIRGASFANEAEVARFTLEAEAAAGLDHSNIVPIYEVGLLEEQPFFTMKLIEGESLAERLRKSPDGRLTSRQVAQWLGKIARAVHHAHQRGVLHRDLKPGNILIDGEGEPWLTDFGLAKLVGCDSGLTRSTDHLGTPNYMAPEVVNGSTGEVSTASDVWALGVLLWEALCGKPPFLALSPVDTMRKIASEEPTPPKGESLDRDLMSLACRCMEKDPARRLQSAGDVAEELDRWMRGEPLSIRRVTGWERGVKWMKRNPVWAALVVALVLGGASSLLLWLRAENAVDSLTHTNTQLTQTLAVSTATKLAMRARLEVHEDSGRALLLAVEAAEMTEEATGSVLPEAAEALYETLQQVGGTDVSPRGVRVEDQGDGFIDRMPPHEYPFRFSPDGRWMLVLDQYTQPSVTAAVYDIKSRDNPYLQNRWPIWKWKPASLCKAVCWLGDSTRLVAIDHSAAIRLWHPVAAPVSPDMPPHHIELGSLARPNEILQRVWLARQPSGNQLRGVAVHQLADESHPLKLTFFTVAPDEAEPVAELARIDFLQLEDPALTYWSISPSLKWLYARKDERTQLVKLRAEEATAEWADLPSSNGRAHAFFSADERWLVHRVAPGVVARCNLSSGSAEEVAASNETVIDHDVDVDAFAVSPDGARLAFADARSVVSIMSASDSSSAVSIGHGGEQWLKLRFSDDGRWLGAGCIEQAVSLWPLQSASEKLHRIGQPRRFRGLSAPVLDVFFSPGVEALIAYGVAAHYRHWSIEGSPHGALPGFAAAGTDSVKDLGLSSDRRWCATACFAEKASDPGPVKLFELGDAAEHIIGVHEGGATGVAISPNGQWLASTGMDGIAMVWDFPSMIGAVESASPMPAPLYRFDMTKTRLEYERQLAFHPQGRLYVTCGDGILFEWNLNDPDPAANVREHPLHSISYLLPDVRVSPDGRWLAVARHGWDYPEEGIVQVGNMVLLYDVTDPDTLKFRAALPANFLETTNIDFSEDSRWLAGGAAGKGATIWDLHAKDIAGSLRESKVSDHHMRAVAFSPGGRWLGLGASDGQLHLWDWQNDDTRTITTDKAIGSMAWKSVSEVATGNAGGEVAVWETDVTRLKATARAMAGRPLSAEEKARFR